uniref:HIG1 domain-containing protein n=1 Tax=Haemonchus contortus TaxID=6289 RepID=A0A7I4Y0G1_HAECO|nr:Hypoxia induced protein domain containing protein [Haemonchus contortus]
MGIFRKVFMSAAGLRDDYQRPDIGTGEVKRERLTPEQVKLVLDPKARHSGIPAIPTDIGYDSGKGIGGKKKNGVVSQVTRNPAVIVGMGLTTLALLGMFRKSFLGDKMGAQKFMRYRVMAQFFTVTALVAGITIFGSTYEKDNIKNMVLQKQ